MPDEKNSPRPSRLGPLDFPNQEIEKEPDTPMPAEPSAPTDMDPPACAEHLKIVRRTISDSCTEEEEKEYIEKVVGCLACQAAIELAHDLEPGHFARGGLLARPDILGRAGLPLTLAKPLKDLAPRPSARWSGLDAFDSNLGPTRNGGDKKG